MIYTHPAPLFKPGDLVEIDTSTQLQYPPAYSARMGVGTVVSVSPRRVRVRWPNLLHGRLYKPHKLKHHQPTTTQEAPPA